MGNNKRSDPVEDVMGCLLGLIFFGAVIALIELMRPRPQPYAPQAPDIPIHAPPSSNASYRPAILGMGVIFSMCGGLYAIDLLTQSPPKGGMAMALGTASLIVLGVVMREAVTKGIIISTNGGHDVPELASTTDPSVPQLAATVGPNGDVQTLSPTSITATSFPPAAVYRITPRPDAAFNPTASQKLVYSLLEVCPQLVFQIEAGGGETTWQVVDLYNQYPGEDILRNVKTHYPDAGVELVNGAELESEAFQPFHRVYVLFSLNNEYVAPLPFVEMLRNDDPLIALTQRMDFLRDDLGEKITYSLVTLTETREGVEAGRKRLQAEKILYLSSEEMLQGIMPLDDKIAAAKRIHKHYHCFLMICLESREVERLYDLRSAIFDITRFCWVGYNQIVEHYASEIYHITDQWKDAHRSLPAIIQRWRQSVSGRWREVLMVLTPPEIAALWHVPDERFSGASIAWNPTKEALVSKPLPVAARVSCWASIAMPEKSARCICPRKIASPIWRSSARPARANPP